MSSVTETRQFANIGAVTTAPFTLKGGKYAVITKSTGAGSISLTALSPDGVTFVPTFTPIAAVAGYAVIDLPPGVYRVEIVTFTANFISITSVPS